jgi:two-component sensor histidine kinase
MPPLVGLADGWRGDTVADSVTTHLLRSFDGSTTLSDAVDEAAAAYDLDPDDVLPGALLAVRELTENALLHL